MTIATLRRQLALGPVEQKPVEKVLPELLSGAEALSADIFERIKNDTGTIEQIDSFLQSSLDLIPSVKRKDLHAGLLSKKATLLFSRGKEEQGLEEYDRALNLKESPSTWEMKGTALLQLERLDQAFNAFQRSYSLKEEFGPQKQAHLENLLGAWSVAALLRCLFGILEQNVSEAEKGASNISTS